MSTLITPTTPRAARAAGAPLPTLVLGGGIAGLTAAWELQRAGLPVQVIEPAAPGGRICTARDGAARIETGMQFYYGGYRETRRLLAEVGLGDQLVPIDVRGRIFYEGSARPFAKTVPWLGHLGLGENLALQWAVARQLRELLRMPLFAGRAREPLDDVDVAEYFLRHGNRRILEVAARPLVNSYAFCEPEGHSLAMMLRLIKLGALSGTYGLRPGNDALPRALAQRLPVLRARAEQVVVEDGRVRGVLVREGERRRLLPAARVVCALRGPQAAEVLPLPEAARLAALPYSSVLLVNLHLDSALRGPEWVYVCARTAGHRAAFAVDLLRRAPHMFPDGRSVLQVDFATPQSDALCGAEDEAVIAQALADLRAFLPDIDARCVRADVVRRPRAMPRFSCGMFSEVRALARAIEGSVEGLFLAGDYLRVPLCEGAVRAGRAAARRARGVGATRRRGARALP